MMLRSRFPAASSLRPLLLAAMIIGGNLALSAKPPRIVEKSGDNQVGNVLWNEPLDLNRRDLFYGPGGAAHQPHGSFEFIKEDLDGSKPKFLVKDDDGMRWKIKLGAEARPETVATRLVWAVGYFADEDYFLPEVHVRDMPAHVHRGQHLIEPGGTMRNVRMKREPDNLAKVGVWRWSSNPFSGSRQENGLAVLMAVINNWDLKDENNAVHVYRGHQPTDQEQMYEVADLGSTFGSAGLQRTDEQSEGNLRAYRRSRFIEHVKPTTVDFEVPGPPNWIVVFNPHQFFSRLPLHRIGQDIPRADARWIGDLLGQLSPDQLRAAFLAANYPAEEIDGFVAIIQERVAQLNGL